MTKILLVEDEPDIGAMIRRGMEGARYTVDWATDGSEGLRRVTESVYALILLDLMLPGLDGWSLCQALRSRRDTTPILMLTARDSLEDRVRGLEIGADDYLLKPFQFPELIARVHALLRRDKVHKARVIRIADLTIDTVARQVTRGGRPVSLTVREYSLLEALAANEGRVLTRDVIQERVWMDGDGHIHTVNVYIGLLRRKIDDGHPIKLIQTVHGLGYRLCCPDEEGGHS